MATKALAALFFGLPSAGLVCGMHRQHAASSKARLPLIGQIGYSSGNATDSRQARSGREDGFRGAESLVLRFMEAKLKKALMFVERQIHGRHGFFE
jgi:hypothetical protein